MGTSELVENLGRKLAELEASRTKPTTEEFLHVEIGGDLEDPHLRISAAIGPSRSGRGTDSYTLFSAPASRVEIDAAISWAARIHHCLGRHDAPHVAEEYKPRPVETTEPGAVAGILEERLALADRVLAGARLRVLGASSMVFVPDGGECTCWANFERADEREVSVVLASHFSPTGSFDARVSATFRRWVTDTGVRRAVPVKVFEGTHDWRAGM
jgi:hypothetical protein